MTGIYSGDPGEHARSASELKGVAEAARSIADDFWAQMRVFAHWYGSDEYGRKVGPSFDDSVMTTYELLSTIGTAVVSTTDAVLANAREMLNTQNDALDLIHEGQAANENPGSVSGGTR